MSDLSQHLYETDFKYGEADTLARRILRDGTKVMQEYYKYRGSYYWVVAGRVLTREEGVRYEAERKKKGLIPA